MQDLNPYAVSSEPTRRKGRPAGDRLTAHDAESLTDFKNVAFLSNYLTPDGRLMPRKQTRLPQRQHRNIMQAIKLARNMALMAGGATACVSHMRCTCMPQCLHVHVRGCHLASP